MTQSRRREQTILNFLFQIIEGELLATRFLGTSHRNRWAYRVSIQVSTNRYPAMRRKTSSTSCSKPVPSRTSTRCSRVRGSFRRRSDHHNWAFFLTLPPDRPRRPLDPRSAGDRLVQCGRFSVWAMRSAVSSEFGPSLHWFDHEENT